jgi:probable HAF family extracellular repeat protein
MARSPAPLVCVLISAGSLLYVPVSHGQSIAASSHPASLSASSATVGAKHFRIRRTIIEAPNGTSTEATDVNNAGVVVGAYNPPEARAFAWTRRAGFVDLEGATAASFSLANAVNECGQVVGELDSNAVRWNTFDEIEFLGTLGGSIATAGDINDRGDVVGFSQVDAGSGRGTPFLWTEQQGMRPIVECEGSIGVASGINNRREVVGSCDDAGNQPQAFFWSAETGRIDLDLPGFLNSSALAINDQGEVTGVAQAPSITPVVAFKWMPRKRRVVLLRDLGDDFSLARAINRIGWIVGDAVDDNDTRRAVIWLTAKRGFKIDPGLGTSSFATGLNDLGSIVGTVDFSDPSDPGPRDLRAVLGEPSPILSRVLSKLRPGRCLRSAP